MVANTYAEYYGGQGSGAVNPPPNKVLAGVAYGPNGDDFTGTAPESQKAPIPSLVRGDDDTTSATTIIAAPTDAGSAASCTTIFAGWSEKHQTGWKVTGGAGTVTDLGGGLWQMRTPLASADTIACRPDCEYKWTHTLVDASGKIRTQKHGVTRLIDGYAVDRFEEA